MNYIDINLSLASPLHVAYPDNLDKTANVSRTTKLGVMVGGGMNYLPIYPANGFRGGLRRKAMARIAAHVKATEGPIPGDLYIGMSCGASSGSPDQTPLSIEEIIRARDNVYMGLFGGGARLHQSAYRVSDMAPVLQASIAAGLVPESCRELVKPKRVGEDGSVEFLGPWEVVGSRTSIRVDDLFRVVRPGEIMDLVADSRAAVTAHQGAVLANKEGRKSDGDGLEKKADVANMMGIETVAPGVPFHFRIDLDGGIDVAKVGLLLLCLNDLFRENAFGGWTRCGFGKVRVSQIVVSHDDYVHTWSGLHGDDGVFSLPSGAATFTEAACQAISRLTIAEMASYFEDFSLEKKAEAKAKARQKKAEKAGVA